MRFGLCAVKNVGEGAILSMLGVRKELGRVDSLYTLCEQVDQRLVNKRPLESLVKAGAFDSLVPTGTIAVAARAAVRRGRQGDRARQPPAAQPRRTATSRSSTSATGRRRPRPSRCPTPRRGPRRSSSPFEKEVARPLHERPSARALHRGAQDLRRPAHRRARAVARRRLGRRHRQRPASAEDQEGRPHGGLHARRHRRRRRGGRLPGDLRQVRPPDRRRRDAARPRQVRERRRDRRASSRPSCSRSRCSRSGRRARWSST